MATSGFPRLHLDFDRLLARYDGPVLSMSAVPERPDVPALDAAGWEPVVGDGSRLVERLLHLQGQGYRIVVGADGAGSAQRLVDTLGAEGVSLRLRTDPTPEQLLEPGGHVVPAPLESGFVLPGQRLAVLTEHDITGRRRAHRRARPRRRGSLASFENLSPGDYVVHHHHGVARYRGMVHRAIMGAERDYLVLDYRGTDKLYLPSDQIDLIRPYSGGEAPSLSKMGGADFARTKAKVRSAVDLIAQELVVLYQRRITTPGHAFAPDSPWQAEMEDLFGYQETPDQRTAIEDVKGDMESPVPMDRLVCGDVGFGKTEVAIRAAFKAAVEGKQVAVLVPTTLLAQQHHQTFSERFANFPVRVEVLSRFLTPSQQREVVKGLADGSVDVVIGTHRLLSSDVRFARLGLLVVDEEQRFGVQHKELMKQMAAHVDVLTLTATPIPRTLEMSLTGIRDLSLLNTPPADRQPILTYVGEHDERAVAEAVRRELLREGQVFFVHNRVADIDQVAAGLRELVPEARVGVAHGQMDEGSLERVVLDFWEGEFDVLMCTTIIESGIDMPTVNTLVVDRADLLGLGQLHQIRGRVGRVGQAGVRLPVPPPRPGPQRGGLRAPEDDRRGHRAGLGIPHRDAGPRDPRRRQPPRRGPVRPHRRGRLRPVLPDGQRGRGQAEGGTGRGTGRGHHRPTHLRPPAVPLRGPRRAAPRGVPAPGRGDGADGGHRHRGGVERPVRAAATRGDGAARCRHPAGRVRPDRDP